MKLRNLVAVFFTLSMVVAIPTRPASAQDSLTPDLSGNNPHWVEPAGDSDDQCWAYSPNTTAGKNLKFRWEGSCDGQIVSGDGKATWSTTNYNSAESTEIRGTFVDGVAQGPVAIQFRTAQPDGSFLEFDGSLLNGLPDGEGTVTTYHSASPWGDKPTILSFYKGIWSHGVLISIESGDTPTSLSTKDNITQYNVPWPGQQPSEVVQNGTQGQSSSTSPAQPPPAVTPDTSAQTVVVTSDSVDSAEEVLVECEGFYGEQLVDDKQYQEFMNSEMATINSDSNSSDPDSLLNTYPLVPFIFKRPTQLWEANHTDGETRRAATRGGNAAESFAQNNDVSGAIQYISNCMKTYSAVATYYDW